MVQIQTKGKKARKPIKFTESSVTSSDPGTTVTLAANNFATQVTADTTVINFDATSIVVDATVNGDTTTVTANAEAPQVIVTTDTGSVVTTTNNVDLSKVEALVTEELVPTAVKPGLAPLAEREAVATATATTTTTPATTTTVAAVATTVVASDPKPTTTPTAAALSSVPTAPASSPLRNDVSYAVGDPVNITIPNVKPGVWLQLILSSPTRVLQTVQANSAGRVVFKTTIPVDTKVSTSRLRPQSVNSNLFYYMYIWSDKDGIYRQKVQIEIGPRDVASTSTTTTTVPATTTTVAATTTTTTSTTSTTTTTVPKYTLTVTPENNYSQTATGQITFTAGGSIAKTCTSFTANCSHTFEAGTAVSIKVTVSATNAFQFTWSDGTMGAIDSQPPCPADTNGSTTSGALIRNSGSIAGELTCSWTMTSATKTLGFHMS